MNTVIWFIFILVPPSFSFFFQCHHRYGNGGEEGKRRNPHAWKKKHNVINSDESVQRASTLTVGITTVYGGQKPWGRRNPLAMKKEIEEVDLHFELFVVYNLQQSTFFTAQFGIYAPIMLFWARNWSFILLTYFYRWIYSLIINILNYWRILSINFKIWGILSQKMFFDKWNMYYRLIY